MMSLQQLVDGARAFIKDCTDVSRGQVLSCKNIIPNELLKCLEQLMFSVNMTTDSTILLVEEGCMWDASILLRSVLDGVARVCYLLCAKTHAEEEQRLHEFQDLLPKAEMGGLEQPVAKLVKSAYYKGTKFSKDPILDPIKSIVDKLKPGNGDGKLLREIKARWNFFKISNILKDEFPVWADFVPVFEYRYALSNQLVHKTDTGCGQVLSRYLLEPSVRELSNVAHAETILNALCLATYTRFVALSLRQNADFGTFEKVWRNHRDYFYEAQAIEDAYVREKQSVDPQIRKDA